MSEQEIIVGPGSVIYREIPPSEDHSDTEVTASGRELDRLTQDYVFEAGDIEEIRVDSRSKIWAWSVIEKMRDHGYWCEMRSPFSTDGGAQWWAGFTPHGTSGWNGRPDHWHSGATLPEAVCRAAVAAMRAQKDDKA